MPRKSLRQNGGPRAHHPRPPPNPSHTTTPIPASPGALLMRKAH